MNNVEISAANAVLAILNDVTAPGATKLDAVHFIMANRAFFSAYMEAISGAPTITFDQLRTQVDLYVQSHVNAAERAATSQIINDFIAAVQIVTTGV